MADDERRVRGRVDGADVVPPEMAEAMRAAAWAAGGGRELAKELRDAAALDADVRAVVKAAEAEVVAARGRNNDIPEGPAPPAEEGS